MYMMLREFHVITALACFFAKSNDSTQKVQNQRLVGVFVLGSSR